MDNNKFESKLEQEIKTFNKVPDSVDEKIQKAFKVIDSKKTKKPFLWNKFVSLAASSVTILFLAGNGVAYAVGAPNIYSWVLNKTGIQREYEEVKQEINQTVDYNGTEVTLLDIAYDDNFIIMGYKFKFKEPISREDWDITDKEVENYCNLTYQIRAIDGNNTTYLGTWNPDSEESIYEEFMDNKYYIFSKKSAEDEIILYSATDISKYKFSDKMDFEIIVGGLGIYYDGGGFDFSELYKDIENARWTFNINGLQKINNIKVYEPKNIKVEFDEIDKYNHKIISKDDINNIGEEDQSHIVLDGEQVEIEIDKIRVSKICSIIHTKINFDWDTVDSVPQHWYVMDIVDENGNIVLDKEVIYDNENYLLPKLNENEKYTIRIYKYYDSYIGFGFVLEDRKGEIEYVTSMDFELPNQ